MVKILEIAVEITDSAFVKGQHNSINMLSFTGEATGDYFHGRIIGTGVDTQRISPDGTMSLSARYMLQGKDHTGEDCRIFIENNGADLSCCKPSIITDSKALADWETAALMAKVVPTEKGVTVSIFKED
ncbi:MAG: DUF3237 family protein [Huintestinicola sp.]